MAINCIRNQPIDFCSRLECYDEAFCIRVQTDDESKVQVELDYKTGTELVTNGQFTTDSDWVKGTGWTITGGRAVATGATGDLEQSGVFVVGNYYWIQFTLLDLISGVINTPIGSTNINGTYQGVFLATSTELIFSTPGTFTGKIDNVSSIELSTLGWNLIDCETGDTLVYNGDGAVGITYLETDISAVGAFQGQSPVGMAMLTFNWSLELYEDLTCFCICIVAESDSSVCELRSQPICKADTHPGTVLIYAENTENFDLGGDDYLNYVNFNFDMTMRVEAHFRAPHWEEDYENFQYSDFGRKTVKFSSVEVLEFTTEELPVSQHRALAAMVGHDIFKIDDVLFHKYGAGLSPDWPKGTDQAGFVIEVVEDSKGLKNSNC